MIGASTLAASGGTGRGQEKSTRRPLICPGEKPIKCRVPADWDEVDFEQRMWTVPGERMKARQTHRVPLTDRAISILKELAEIRQSDFIFAGMRQGRPIGIVAMGTAVG